MRTCVGDVYLGGLLDTSASGRADLISSSGTFSALIVNGSYLIGDYGLGISTQGIRFVVRTSRTAVPSAGGVLESGLTAPARMNVVIDDASLETELLKHNGTTSLSATWRGRVHLITGTNITGNDYTYGTSEFNLSGTRVFGARAMRYDPSLSNDQLYRLMHEAPLPPPDLYDGNRLYRITSPSYAAGYGVQVQEPLVSGGGQNNNTSRGGTNNIRFQLSPRIIVNSRPLASPVPPMYIPVQSVNVPYDEGSVDMGAHVLDSLRYNLTTYENFFSVSGFRGRGTPTTPANVVINATGQSGTEYYATMPAARDDVSVTRLGDNVVGPVIISTTLAGGYSLLGPAFTLLSSRIGNVSAVLGTLSVAVGILLGTVEFFSRMFDAGSEENAERAVEILQSGTLVESLTGASGYGAVVANSGLDPDLEYVARWVDTDERVTVPIRWLWNSASLDNLGAAVAGVSTTILPDKSLKYYHAAGGDIQQRTYARYGTFLSSDLVVAQAGGTRWEAPCFFHPPHHGRSLSRQNPTNLSPILGAQVGRTSSSRLQSWERSVTMGSSFSVPVTIQTSGYDAVEIEPIRGTPYILGMLRRTSDSRWYRTLGTVTEGTSISWASPELVSAVPASRRERGSLSQDPDSGVWYFGYVTSGGAAQVAISTSQFGEPSTWS